MTVEVTVPRDIGSDLLINGLASVAVKQRDSSTADVARLALDIIGFSSASVTLLLAREQLSDLARMTIDHIRRQPKHPPPLRVVVKKSGESYLDIVLQDAHQSPEDVSRAILAALLSATVEESQ